MRHPEFMLNNGRVPYWMHLAGVAQILDWGIQRGNEIRDEALQDDLYTAALAHDLYEDTAWLRRSAWSGAAQRR